MTQYAKKGFKVDKNCIRAVNNIDFEKFINDDSSSDVVKKAKCEFCGKKKPVASTSIVSNYCISCHKNVIEQSEDAVKRIKASK